MLTDRILFSVVVHWKEQLQLLLGLSTTYIIWASVSLSVNEGSA